MACDEQQSMFITSLIQNVYTKQKYGTHNLRLIDLNTCKTSNKINVIFCSCFKKKKTEHYFYFKTICKYSLKGLRMNTTVFNTQ